MAPTIDHDQLAGGTVGRHTVRPLQPRGTRRLPDDRERRSLDGMSLTDGTISGTPTATGTFNFTVKATNDAGSDTQALEIVISDAPVAPTITTVSLQAVRWDDI